ncbi:hypothetical protein QOT17_25608 [Balamuthia mandrillaris]
MQGNNHPLFPLLGEYALVLNDLDQRPSCILHMFASILHHFPINIVHPSCFAHPQSFPPCKIKTLLLKPVTTRPRQSFWTCFLSMQAPNGRILPSQLCPMFLEGCRATVVLPNCFGLCSTLCHYPPHVADPFLHFLDVLLSFPLHPVPFVGSPQLHKPFPEFHKFLSGLSIILSFS